MPDWFNAQLLVSVITIAIMVHVLLILDAYLVQAERKISAYIQDRIGPNRVGFDFGLPALSFLKGCLGLGQPLADGIKFLLKEDYTPSKADKILFTLGPATVVIPALIGFVVIPWGGQWAVPEFTIPLVNIHIDSMNVTVAGANINVGIVYLLAVAALGVYGIAIGGYASNSKYSFLGGLRATAQMLSYEIPLGLSILVAMLIIGSVGAMDIIRYQTEHGWLVLSCPLAAVLFYICSLAESNRAPFDNAECEQELVGGYHTEYSSMRFALFFLAEYTHLITGSAFFVLLFFGGFHLPYIDALGVEPTGFLAVLAKIIVFMTKVVLVVCMTMVVRWSIPRLRYDQIMQMAWSGLIPISLLLVVVTSVLVYLGKTDWYYMLAANAAVGVLTVVAIPFMSPSMSNRKIPLYGSRFNPMPGERVITRPTDPNALEDRPVQGSLPVG